jgi:glycosyltransferase involved in cell wall biosynthesis
MDILYFGTYEEDYSRNQIMIKALRALGHNVKEIHISLWGGAADKTGTLSGLRNKMIFACRLASIYPRLFIKYLQAGKHDLIFVGYFGHLDMLFLKLFKLILFRREKIVFDVFLSLFDSMIIDRKMAGSTSLLARITYALDSTACRIADIVILDTNAHCAFFHDTFKVPLNKMFRVYASADQAVFYPRPAPVKAPGFTVLFVGKYIPLHGIEYIVGAADILKGEDDIRFIFIGKGQLYPEIQRMVHDKNLSNIEFIDWVKYETLPDYLAAADVCLGIFSATDKASRVIPNKVFQAMAMGKAVITGRTPGSAEGLVDGSNILLCNVADPEDLARAIKRLKEDAGLKELLERNARHTFEQIFGEEAVKSSLVKVLEAARS